MRCSKTKKQTRAMVPMPFRNFGKNKFEILISENNIYIYIFKDDSICFLYFVSHFGNS